ncbi:folate-binding protein [Nocardiopsis sp. EMB25]|uniref:CAF17-like 4Fe-4S cluster assembly/insertion protein YgfZ n=1 Tax=Nocardiopsis sp. EMB25 TaxID=2835867 RepID=UPI002283AA8A|nr:glycine cleavage T C-terminal barrel domain-containing protein [Nocardiopsis sp. EMB25]MCY9786155.1 folate-binding protein [Nocardiopsis sp. EMB25]
MTSPLLTTPGAVTAESIDAGVAAHYGDPAHEGRAIERSSAWVDRSNRGVVRVSGPDRLGWLNDLTSQLTRDLPPGTATEALVLDTRGHLRHHLSLVDDGEATWIHTEPGGGPGLAAFLDSMRFMLRVEVADLSDSHSVLTVLGPKRAQAVDDADDVLDGVVQRRTEDETDLFLPAERLVEAAEALTTAGARPAGMWAYEAHRIAAHRVRPGVDTDDRTIPHEVDWVDRAVHLEKGCYPGQETVARVHNLGRPPRRLVLLHLDGTAERLPEVGAAIELEGRAVGRVGSSARHHELGPIALGVVKRAAPADADFVVEGIAAGQEVVVDPDTGANAQINLRRRPR